MLIKCPNCKTTYKVSDEVLKGATAVFRCSRCKHTFELEQTAPLEKPNENLAPTEAPAIKAGEERELSFTFAPRDQEETKAPIIEHKDFVDTATPGPQIETSVKETPDHWSMSENATKREEPFTISTARHAVEEEKTLKPREDSSLEESVYRATPPGREISDNILAMDPYRDQPTSGVLYLSLFVLLVVFFSLVTAFHHAHPKATEEFLRKIPLVGPAVLKNNHLKNGVILQNLRANYQTIQGNREVLVVTGVARNQNPVVIRGVRVTGQIYNQEGKETEQQTIWVGNPISPKIARGMTAQDISNLQRLPPLKTFEIPPGDSVQFTIVFLKSAKGAKDFTCGVLSAEGEA